MGTQTSLLQKLETRSFAQFVKGLSEVRTTLEKKKERTVTSEEFLAVLRPYFWYLHDPGFQDLYDAAFGAMEVLQKHRDILLTETLPLIGNDFLALATLLGHYCDDGRRNTSGFASLFASAEISAMLIAQKFAEQLAAANAPPEHVQALERIGGLLQAIEGTRHDAYYCLRVVGSAHLEQLAEVIHAVDGDAQGFVLHALDAFKGDAKVVRFYDDYTEKVRSGDLPDEAKQALIDIANKYRARVAPASAS